MIRCDEGKRQARAQCAAAARIATSKWASRRVTDRVQPWNDLAPHIEYLGVCVGLQTPGSTKRPWPDCGRIEWRFQEWRKARIYEIVAG